MVEKSFYINNEVMWYWVCGCCVKPIVSIFFFLLLFSSQIPYPVSCIRGTQNIPYASTCFTDDAVAHSLRPSSCV